MTRGLQLSVHSQSSRCYISFIIFLKNYLHNLEHTVYTVCSFFIGNVSHKFADIGHAHFGRKRHTHEALNLR
jgi:hypothetical protein